MSSTPASPKALGTSKESPPAPTALQKWLAVCKAGEEGALHHALGHISPIGSRTRSGPRACESSAVLQAGVRTSKPHHFTTD